MKVYSTLKFMPFLSNQPLRKWHRKFPLFKEIFLFFQISLFNPFGFISTWLSPVSGLITPDPCHIYPYFTSLFIFFFMIVFPTIMFIAAQDSKIISLLSLSKSLTSKLILMLVLVSFTLPLTCLFEAPAMTATTFFLD